MTVLVNNVRVLHTLITAAGDNTWYIPQAKSTPMYDVFSFSSIHGGI